MAQSRDLGMVIPGITLNVWGNHAHMTRASYNNYFQGSELLQVSQRIILDENIMVSGLFFYKMNNASNGPIDIVDTSLFKWMPNPMNIPWLSPWNDAKPN